jgi:hypothetical protein
MIPSDRTLVLGPRHDVLLKKMQRPRVCELSGTVLRMTSVCTSSTLGFFHTGAATVWSNVAWMRFGGGLIGGLQVMRRLTPVQHTYSARRALRDHIAVRTSATYLRQCELLHGTHGMVLDKL